MPQPQAVRGTDGRSATKAAVVLLALAVGTVLSPACSFKGNDAPPTPTEQALSAWQPEPVSMRVYPSTRFVAGGTEPYLLVRIELTDEMGDSIKAAGKMHLELRRTTGAAAAVARDRLYAWDVPLHTLEDQQRHYDRVTRTYQFRLRLDEPITSQRDTSLFVVLSPTDGRRLEASAVLPDPAP